MEPDNIKKQIEFLKQKKDKKNKYFKNNEIDDIIKILNDIMSYINIGNTNYTNSIYDNETIIKEKEKLKKELESMEMENISTKIYIEDLQKKMFNLEQKNIKYKKYKKQIKEEINSINIKLEQLTFSENDIESSDSE